MNDSLNFASAIKAGKFWFPVIYLGENRHVFSGLKRRTQIGAIQAAESQLRACMPCTGFQRLAY